MPYIPSGSKLYSDLLAVDGFVKRADGSVYDCGICFTPGFKDKGGTTGVVDYTNPRAVKVHQAVGVDRGLQTITAGFERGDVADERARGKGLAHLGQDGGRLLGLSAMVVEASLYEVDLDNQVIKLASKECEAG